MECSEISSSTEHREDAMSLIDLPAWLYGEALEIIGKMLEKIVRLTMGLRKAWHEMKEAQHRARKAELETSVAEESTANLIREQRLITAKNRIRDRYNEHRLKDPNILPIIRPLPGEDNAIFQEALRQVNDELGLSLRPRRRG